MSETFMSKQQLASKIWTSVNKMRSKIEANEYKDYILGFIFYKYLSEKEVKYLKENDWTDKDIEEVTEDDFDTVEDVQRNIGYFISYDNLFSTWIKEGQKFGVNNVTVGISAFNRLINPTHKRVFEGIFDTLEIGLDKLGESDASRSKTIRELIQLINIIPMSGKQTYDVLGFIYEYLLENFAANAGKKAGEFYTPHEVSLLMSEIVADHLKDRDKIDIYDPTSGSGSLLINIGKCAAKHIGDENKIKYYAQELKENTYNLTRMNLIMRGVIADNITVRNGDTLEDDWPFFDENDKEGTYNPLYVDAVVSNPPYSQDWDPANKENDPRYAGYGLAPKSKADYAFLLHDLYHIKPDGIMTIVLPHGVLFRGNEEGIIRKNLIEKNKIDAIIGLPANIFYGTGIPTIIMVLKQKRKNDDVLIIDASKGFEKEGKNNKLRASDIKKIVDTIVNRETIDKFSRVVTRKEIEDNDYNLNIPRYVDSAEPSESWDLYATMCGGLPSKEVDQLDEYWKAFPSLRTSLFDEEEYCKPITNEIKKIITENKDVINFENNFHNSFNDFEDYLYKELIEKMPTVNVAKAEEQLSQNIFNRLKGIPLVDKYEAYQLLDNTWGVISSDLETIQSEGFAAIKKVEKNIIIKKKNNTEAEVQDGWKGHILPFELVQSIVLSDDLNDLNSINERLNEIAAEYSDLIDALPEESQKDIVNDDSSAFVSKEIINAVKKIKENINTPEIELLNEYLTISDKSGKLDFISSHSDFSWNEMECDKNGTYSKKEVNKYISKLSENVTFEEGTYEYIVLRANDLLQEEKDLKKKVKDKTDAIHEKTKETIENLSDEQAFDLLRYKWIKPLINDIMKLPISIVNTLISKIETIEKKYATSLPDMEKEIIEVEKSLSSMIDDIEGNDFDMLGLAEFKKLIGGC